MVKETEFYDLLGVAPDASKAQIRRAYYAKAKLCHPDRFPGDDAKEAEFKALSEAYATLFDDESRSAYDRLGRGGMSHGTNIDPRAVYAAVFGGPELEPWVGVLGMNAPLDEQIVKAHEDSVAAQAKLHMEVHRRTRDGPPLSPAEAKALRARLAAADEAVARDRAVLDVEVARVQAERVAKCVDWLRAYVQDWTAGGPAGAQALQAKARRDLEKLRRVSLGEPMAHAIGYVYRHESQRILGVHGVGVHKLRAVAEGALRLGHNLSEGLAALGSIAGLAGDAARLVSDAQAEEAAAISRAAGDREAAASHKPMSEARKEEIARRIAARTFSLVWRATKRDMEDTLRSVVGALLSEEATEAEMGMDGQPGAAAAGLVEPSLAAAGDAIPIGAAADGAGASAPPPTATLRLHDISDASAPPRPPRTAPIVDVPPHVLARANALIAIGAIFMEAMPFERFVARDHPPSAAERAQYALETKLRAQGLDVDGLKRAAVEAREKALRAAAEASTNAGSAINALLGLDRQAVAHAAAAGQRSSYAG